ncbi:MAG: hypothetical protein KF833_18705 [Verrucomicrobiae bacterium]|nr:hypothetical protein [Verrucomicrobiae bacterium]
MGSKNIRTPDPDDSPIGDEELATHREAQPVPWMAGTRRIALRWLDDALDIKAVQAPNDRPGKK